MSDFSEFLKVMTDSNGAIAKATEDAESKRQRDSIQTHQAMNRTEERLDNYGTPGEGGKP